MSVMIQTIAEKFDYVARVNRYTELDFVRRSRIIAMSTPKSSDIPIVVSYPDIIVMMPLTSVQIAMNSHFLMLCLNYGMSNIDIDFETNTFSAKYHYINIVVRVNNKRQDMIKIKRNDRVVSMDDDDDSSDDEEKYTTYFIPQQVTVSLSANYNTSDSYKSAIDSIVLDEIKEMYKSFQDACSNNLNCDK